MSQQTRFTLTQKDIPNRCGFFRTAPTAVERPEGHLITLTLTKRF